MTPTAQALEDWLAPLDRARLECDGMTRAVATLLLREGIPHRTVIGQLAVHCVGQIETHFWIELDDGYIVDLRARMWLGHAEDVPHGVFQPTEKQKYIAGEHLELKPLAPTIFRILTDMDLSQFEPIAPVT